MAEIKNISLLDDDVIAEAKFDEGYAKSSACCCSIAFGWIPPFLCLWGPIVFPCMRTYYRSYRCVLTGTELLFGSDLCNCPQTRISVEEIVDVEMYVTSIEIVLYFFSSFSKKIFIVSATADVLITGLVMQC